ncbi:DUF6578 domain-containing protein [Microterricola viridarii]|uniref:Uncharacterized protein n=1 Tax=Microterricola viridarii TaxID=412690 RepID=A0A120I0Z4_9MICO|nr:DUF6578 domain-containing protein [Microterricola viridarii]AMB58519.1 hypothetical protein AWU67_06225 [Microterricola viridarii]
MGESASHEVDVWLREWQVSEDGLRVALGESVSWDLVPMDQEWMTRLFGERRTVPLQLDTYASATRAPDAPDWTRIRGDILAIEQVSVRYTRSTDPSEVGSVPEPGAAVTLRVPSLWPKHPHIGSVVGWIVRVRMPSHID